MKVIILGAGEVGLNTGSRLSQEGHEVVLIDATSIGAVASCLGNVGPGFGLVGPVSTYKDLSGIARWVLSFCMIVGRVEIFTLLVTMLPFYWKN